MHKVLRGYLLAILLGVTLLDPLPLTALGAGLLLANIGGYLRPWPPRLKLALSLANTLVAPLLVQPAMAMLTAGAAGNWRLLSFPVGRSDILAVALCAPLFLLLSHQLAENAPDELAGRRQDGRAITPTTAWLLATAAIVAACGFLVGNAVALLTASLGLLYLGCAFLRAGRVLAGELPSCAPVRLRVIAGRTAEAELVLQTKPRAALLLSLRAGESWLAAQPARLQLNGRASVVLKATPPLSGPSRPPLSISVADTWGLLTKSYVSQPLTLEVIPRARYLRRLAEGFLAGAGTEDTASVTAPVRRALKRGKGVEYLSSREYQPGDRLKDIDFKHSLKLGKVVAKDYLRASGSTAILVANLTVASPEAADRVGANLISAALTLAQENTPTALALYNQHGVLLVTPPGEPHRALQAVLLRHEQLDICPGIRRRLSRPAANAGAHAAAPPGTRLRELLLFQHEAQRLSLAGSPAAEAVRQVTARVAPPAIVLFVSQPASPAEELSLDLMRGRYEVINLAAQPEEAQP